MSNDYKKNESSQLTYKNGLFQITLYLKQGFYNYKYVAVNRDNKIIQGNIDGNFDETENEYNVIVYYRNYGERYDRVVGVGKGLSKFITN